MLFALIVSSGVEVFCQELPYHLNITHYTDDDGLAHKAINSVIQDHRGFLWIGTQDGLTRFDGSEFLLYRHGEDESSSLPGATVLCMVEDSMGRIWIGTHLGLCWLDPILGVLHQLPIKDLETPMIWSLLVHDGKLWVGTANHAHRIDLENFAMESFEVMPVVEGMPYFHLDCMILYDDHTIVAAGASGLHTIDTRTGETNHELCKIGYAYHVSRFQDDKLLVCTFKYGTFEYDFSSGEKGRSITYTYADERNVFSNNVTDIEEQVLEDGKRILWVTGGYHLKAIDAQNLQCLATYDLLSGNQVEKADDLFTYDIQKAKDGSYWVSSQQGLFRVNVEEELFKKVPSVTQGYTLDGFIDPTDKNAFWLIKDIGTVELYDLKTKTLKAEYSCRHLLQAGERITDMVTDDNRVWFNTTRKGLYYFDIKTRTFSCVIPAITYEPDLQLYHQIALSPEGDVWQSTPDGLCKLDVHENSQSCYELDSLQIDGTFNPETGPGGSILFDSKRRVWLLINYKSCYVLHPGSNALKEVEVFGLFGRPLLQHSLQKFTEDNKGHIWLGGFNGMFLYNETTGKFEIQDVGFPKSGIGHIVSDTSGRLWGVNGPWLYCTSSVTGITQYFSAPDGLSNDAIWNLSFQPSTNTIYVSYPEECLFFNPDRLTPQQKELSIGLLEFKLLGKDSIMPSTEWHQPLLHYKDNDLRLAYKLLDFESDKNLNYAYMLKGSDEGWIDAGPNKSAIYTNLREGDYEFWVKANRLSGDRYPPQKLASFTIATPFWRTIWFRTLAIGTIFILLYGLYRYRIGQLKRVISVRSKISSDLHDDIGSALTSIRVYSEMARKQPNPDLLSGVLDKIEETAGDMIQSMSDIVWMINPKYDDFSFVIQRMENFASTFLSLHEIQYAISKENGVESVRLPMEKRKELFLIFKEAINNAAKHAGCKSVQISFSHLSDSLVMKVADDGGGFDMKSIQNGNGLGNMTQRASHIGGEISIQSTPGSGTQVSLKLPI